MAKPGAKYLAAGLKAGLTAGLIAGVCAAVLIYRPALPNDSFQPERLSFVEWSDDADEFGGMSGLAIIDGGMALRAVSDGGVLFKAGLSRDATGKITAVKTEGHSRFLDNLGRRVAGFHADAEALRIAADHSLIVAFEGYARVARFAPPDMMPKPLQIWDRFRSLWGNEGIEALAIADSGQIIAVLEGPLPGSARYRTFVYAGGTVWTDGPDLISDGAFQATDADYGPDGRLYVLERDLSVLWGFTTRISAYSPLATGFSAPAVMMVTARGEYGDFEGLDVWADARGRTIATVISDSNFLPFARTTIAEFILGR